MARYLEKQGRGVHLAGAVVPQVVGAILFDLELGDNHIHPDTETGYKAALAAMTGHFAKGNVGASAGVGKLFGMKAALKTDLGTASLRHRRDTFPEARAARDHRSATSPLFRAAEQSMVESSLYLP